MPTNRGDEYMVEIADAVSADLQHGLGRHVVDQESGQSSTGQGGD